MERKIWFLEITRVRASHELWGFLEVLIMHNLYGVSKTKTRGASKPTLWKPDLFFNWHLLSKIKIRYLNWQFLFVQCCLLINLIRFFYCSLALLAMFVTRAGSVSQIFAGSSCRPSNGPEIRGSKEGGKKGASLNLAPPHSPLCGYRKAEKLCM